SGDGFQEGPFHDDPQQPTHEYDEGDHEERIDVQAFKEKQRRKHAHDQEHAVGKVHDAHHPKNQAQADADNGIDPARKNPVNDDLDEFDHGPRLADRGYFRAVHTGVGYMNSPTATSRGQRVTYA